MADITSSGLMPNALFGREKDLMSRYQVGRGTLREAVRQVERNGAARMRRGGGGGLIVANPIRGVTAHALATYLELSDVTVAEQFDTRIVLEGLAAKLAAERADEAAINSLRACVREIERLASREDADARLFELRVAIAEASGNRALPILIGAFHRLAIDLRPMLRSGSGTEFGYIEDQFRHKRELIELIASGRASAAQEKTRAEAAYLKGRPEVAPQLNSAIGELLLQAGQSYVRKPGEREEEKLGIVIALGLRRDIAAMGWPAGRNLGSERELCVRYSVGRGVLREAVALLELHGIVSIRNGRGGGVKVGRLDASHALSTAAAHLAGAMPQDRDLWEIRQEIDAEAALTLGQRITPAGISALQAHAQIMKDPTESKLEPRLVALHREIHLQAGNRASALIADVIAAHLSLRGKSILLGRSEDDAKARHFGVVQALVAGDAPIAARRMRNIWIAH